MLYDNSRQALLTGAFVLVLASACAIRSATVDALTPDELRSRCHLPGKCWEALACEGEVVVVRGRVDYNNVFDRARFPQLPYEKFRIVDAASGTALEVSAVSNDNGPIFRTLLGARGKAPVMVRVRGTVRGFDMPTMGRCTRDAGLDLQSPADLVIEPQE